MNQIFNARAFHKAQTAVQSTTSGLHRLVLTDFVRNHPDEELRKRGLGAIRARDVKLLLKWADDLVEQKYPTAYLHRYAHQIAALIRKYPWKGTADDAERAAWVKFQKYERRCRHMNHLIKRRETQWDPEADASTWMRGLIAHLIGVAPNWERVFGKCGFGPGAAIGCTGDETSFARKLLAENLSCTPSAIHYAIAAMRACPHVVEYLGNDGSLYPLPAEDLAHIDLWAQLVNSGRVAFVNYNKITFVPKTALVFRSIAVEPSLNGYVQKGLDEELRRLLRNWGLDLRDQEANKKKAYLGSRDWDHEDPYCTIDLSSASDLISVEWARVMLPPAWFETLNACRSKNFMYKKQLYKYNKFSSMGNGFTFPLQTLLFAAVCARACTEANVPFDFRVYGDDIIVRRSVFDRVIKLLRHFGAVPNLRKTFSEGEFRESCGGDYFGGVDVRPVFLTEELQSIEALHRFHNALSTQTPHYSFLWDTLAKIRNYVPQKFRFLRPLRGDESTAFEVPMDVFMAESRYATWNPSLYCWSWPEFLFRSVPDNGWMGTRGEHLLLYMAALQGSSPDMPYAYRRKTRRSVRMVSHSCGGIYAVERGASTVLAHIERGLVGND